MSWLLVLRTLRRRRARSMLVLLLCAVPAALLGATSVLVPSVQTAQREQGVRTYGHTQVQVFPRVELPSVTPEQVTALLPAGSRAVARETGFARVRTGSETATGTVLGLDVADPLMGPVVDVHGGRAAAGPGEALLTPDLAEALGARVGTTVTVSGRGLRVVGIGRLRNEWHARALVLLPGQGVRAALADGRLLTVAAGVEPTAIGQTGRDLDLLSAALLVLLGLGLASVTVGAALRVTARAAVLDLRLVHETGAARHDLRRLLARQGLVLGVAGGALGVLLGLALGVVALPAMQRLANQELDHTRVSPTLALTAVALTALAGLLGATAAGRTTLDAVTAGGRAPQRPMPLSWPRAAVALAVVGLGLVLLPHAVGRATVGWAAVREGLLGALLLLAGVVGLAPAVLAGWQLVGGRRGPATRVATREGVRRNSRQRLSVAAIVAALTAAVASSTVLAANDAQSSHQFGGIDQGQVLPRDLVVVDGFDVSADDLSALLGGAEVRTSSAVTLVPGVTAVGTSGRPVGQVARSAPGLLEVLAAHGDRARAEADLSAGLVLLNADAPASTVVDIQGLPLPTSRALGWPSGGELPDALLSAAQADRVAAQQGGEPDAQAFLTQAAVVARLRAPLSESAALDVQERAQRRELRAATWRQTPVAPRSSQTLAVVLGLVAAAFALVVAGFSTALSSADGEEDALVLARTGAGPRGLRRLRVARSLAVVGPATVASAALGGLLGVLLVRAQTQPAPVTLPSPALVLLLGLPAVTAALAWLLPLRGDALSSGALSSGARPRP